MSDNNEVKVTTEVTDVKPQTGNHVKPLTSFLSNYKQFIYGFITGGLVVLVGSKLHNQMKPTNQGCYF